MHKIIISDPVRLRAAIEFAIKVGCLEQFGRDLCRLLQVVTMDMVRWEDDKLVEAPGTFQAEIGRDFAPHSFSFAIWRGSDNPFDHRERGDLMLNGGFIYAGPGAPGDGSSPAYSVDLAWVTGQRPRHSWNVHT
jgi:hypothetical protein